MVKTNGGGHLVSKDATIEFSCEEEELGVNIVSITGLKFRPRCCYPVLRKIRFRRLVK